ncbi:Myoneurin [Porphyridium purpureum]|uniref:Myoneurin n=1 Tax=Porphyridium purpureum TaxID=35688 RepID=A0A5J4Z5C7_PORPP|nr:Myoneurin [Porphyridium purpureum]|eukprot:POR8435..scf295_1
MEGTFGSFPDELGGYASVGAGAAGGAASSLDDGSFDLLAPVSLGPRASNLTVLTMNFEPVHMNSSILEKGSSFQSLLNCMEGMDAEFAHAAEDVQESGRHDALGGYSVSSPRAYFMNQQLHQQPQVQQTNLPFESDALSTDKSSNQTPESAGVHTPRLLDDMWRNSLAIQDDHQHQQQQHQDPPSDLSSSSSLVTKSGFSSKPEQRLHQQAVGETTPASIQAAVEGEGSTSRSGGYDSKESKQWSGMRRTRATLQQMASAKISILMRNLQTLLANPEVASFFMDHDSIPEMTPELMDQALELCSEPVNAAGQRIAGPEIRYIKIPVGLYKDYELYVVYAQGPSLVAHLYLKTHEWSPIGRTVVWAPDRANPHAREQVEFRWTNSAGLVVSCLSANELEITVLALHLSFDEADGAFPSILQEWSFEITHGRGPGNEVAGVIGPLSKVLSRREAFLDFDVFVFREMEHASAGAVSHGQSADKDKVGEVTRAARRFTACFEETPFRKAVMEYMAEQYGMGERDEVGGQGHDRTGGVTRDSMENSSNELWPMKQRTSFEVRSEGMAAAGGIHALHSWAQALRAHQSLLENECKHACTMCSFSFMKRHDLKRHIDVVHLNKRDYECSLCGAEFGRESNLRRHCVAKHGRDKPYNCKRCNVGFSTKRKLTEHSLKCTFATRLGV